MRGKGLMMQALIYWQSDGPKPCLQAIAGPVHRQMPHLSTHGKTKGAVSVVSQSVHSRRQGSLGSQHTRHFALELWSCLPHQAGMVDQPVLRRIVLGFQRSEECLLSAQDLRASPLVHCMSPQLARQQRRDG